MELFTDTQERSDTTQEPQRTSFGDLFQDTMRLMTLWKNEIMRLIAGRREQSTARAEEAAMPNDDEGRVARMGRHLYRSRRDRMVRGVCAGLADYFGIPVALVRLAFVILFFTGIVHAVIPYVVLALLIPEAPWEEVRR